MLVYDGSCGFCSRSVQFILRHERRHDLLFVTRDSPLGKDLRRKFHLEAVESMLWIVGRRGRDRVGRSSPLGEISRRNLGEAGCTWLAGSVSDAQLGVSPDRAQSQATVVCGDNLPGSDCRTARAIPELSFGSQIGNPDGSGYPLPPPCKILVFNGIGGKPRKYVQARELYRKILSRKGLHGCL